MQNTVFIIDKILLLQQDNFSKINIFYVDDISVVIVEMVSSSL